MTTTKLHAIAHLQTITTESTPFAALDTDVQRKVEKWQRELTVGMGAFGRAGLEIGRVLAEARTVLKPLRVWMAFLHTVPGMTARTADRFVGRYEMARRRLPATVLALATTTGVDLAGTDERSPYGRYTKAVKRVGPPPRGDDAAKASKWLAEVLEAGKRKRPVAIEPVERATSTLVRLAQMQSDDSDAQVKFVSTVLKRVLRELGYRETLTVRSGARTGAKAA